MFGFIKAYKGGWRAGVVYGSTLNTPIAGFDTEEMRIPSNPYPLNRLLLNIIWEHGYQNGFNDSFDRWFEDMNNKAFIRKLENSH